MKKYMKIYGILFKDCLASQMQYRFNFVMGILVDGVFFFNKLIYALIIYKTGTCIGGLLPDEVLLYVGTFSIIQGLYTTFFLVNLNQTLPESIRTGDLDLYMVKPVSLQFLVSCKYIELSTMIPDLLGGIMIVGIAINRLNYQINFISFVMYGLLVLVGTMLSYSILFSIQLLSFFFIKVNAISDISGELFGLNNLPSKVYHKAIQFIGTFVFPIFLVTNVAPKCLNHQISLVGGTGFIIGTIGVFVISRALWNKVTCIYTSASS